MEEAKKKAYETARYLGKWTEADLERIEKEFAEVNERELFEIPAFQSQITYTGMTEMCAFAYEIFGRIYKTLVNLRDCEGFKLLLCYDKKSEKDRVKIRLWDLMNPEGPDKPDSPEET